MSFIKRFPDWWEFRSFAVFCCNGYCCLLLRMRICFASIDAERCNCYSVREDFAYFPDSPLKTGSSGTSLVGQWLRLHTPKAGGLGSIPDQGKSHMPQSSRAPAPQLLSLSSRAQSCSYWAYVLLRSTHLEPVLRNERSHYSEKPMQQLKVGPTRHS